MLEEPASSIFMVDVEVEIFIITALRTSSVDIEINIINNELVKLFVCPIYRDYNGPLLLFLTSGNISH
jgi:hypothetical protein